MMKKVLCSVMLLVLAGAVPAAWGTSWAEWNFGDGFAGDELVADTASDPGSLLRRNVAGSSVYTIGGGIMTCTGSLDAAEFLQVDINDSVPNGGGAYLNDFTLIWDIKTDADPDWIGLFNANPPNSNAAELWLAGDGSVGKGGNYTAGGVVPGQTWTRLAVKYWVDQDNLLGNGSDATYQSIYANGVPALEDVWVSYQDSSWSFYTNGDSGREDHQWSLFGGWDGAMYLDGFELDNFAFIDTALTNDQIAALGTYNSDGIGIPEPATLLLLGLGSYGILRRKSS